jgi:hypothetical protein
LTGQSPQRAVVPLEEEEEEEAMKGISSVLGIGCFDGSGFFFFI